MRIAECRPFSQEQALDALGQPWVYDPDVGVIVAPVDDGGDGAYRYERQDGQVCIVPNPAPTSSEEMQARYDAMLRRVFEAVERSLAAEAERSARRAARRPARSPSPEGDPVEDEELPAHPEKPRRQRTEDAADAALLDRCTIQRTQRSNSSRYDMVIITPDGFRFRSKVSALAHMQQNCDECM